MVEQTVLEQIHGGFMVRLGGCQVPNARKAIFRARVRQINSRSSISPAVVHYHILHGSAARYNNLLLLLVVFALSLFRLQLLQQVQHTTQFSTSKILLPSSRLFLRFSSLDLTDVCLGDHHRTSHHLRRSSFFKARQIFQHVVSVTSP